MVLMLAVFALLCKVCKSVCAHSDFGPPLKHTRADVQPQKRNNELLVAQSRLDLIALLGANTAAERN